MTRRNLLYVLGLGSAVWIGYQFGTGGNGGAVLPGVSPALADGTISVKAGETFVSTHAGSAYLWRRDGDRIVLLNECSRIVGGPDGQATYVSAPGVERGS